MWLWVERLRPIYGEKGSVTRSPKLQKTLASYLTGCAFMQVMEIALAKSLPNSHRVPQSEDPQANGFQELFFLLVSLKL